MVSSNVPTGFRKELTNFSISLYSNSEDQSVAGQYLEIDSLPIIFLERHGIIPKRIYIRHCYRELYEIVTARMIEYHDQLPATLFTGVPGIGKSLFMIYFLFMFLHDERFPDKRFVLEFASGEYHYFIPTTEVGVFEYSMTSQGSCPLHEVPIFSDIKGLSEPRCRGKWLFIFSSPNPLRYKETTKNSPKFRYTLPIWSHSELLFLDHEDKKWIDRFVLFGGVPRNIFWDGKEEDPKDKLEDALESKGGIIADYFFKHGLVTWILTKVICFCT